VIALDGRAGLAASVLGCAAMERKRTPLWQMHKQLGARLVDFGGWDMPIQYPAGTIKEHRAVRESVGLFDVSHMGEAVLRGPRVREAVEHLTSNSVASAPVGRATYTLLCRPDGGVIDDCIFYKRSDTEFFVIINASNTAKDLAWFRDQTHSLCEIEDQSDATALIAVQGPQAVALVDRLAGGVLAGMSRNLFIDTEVAGVRCMAAFTGYTGEDGFELACASGDAVRLWSALLDHLPPGGLPIGLGARDTLRLEARLPLYGNDLDEDHTPLEAGLGWAVKLDREFIGAEALREQKQRGLTRQLAGFTIAEGARAIARQGYAVVDRAFGSGESAVIGAVTSGGPGICVGGAIGLAYVPVASARPGTSLTIDCRGKDIPATVVSGKFYKGQRFGTIESVKSVSDLYAPVSGKVTAVNGSLKDSPEQVNTEPYGAGWIIEVEPTEKSEIDELLTPDAYSQHVAAQ
jgi:aminomethyltransferase